MGLTGFGDLMAFERAAAARPLSHRGIGWSEGIALVSAAFAMALGAAAWMADANETTALATAALPQNQHLSFEDRFFPTSTPAAPAIKPELQPLDRSALALIEMKLWDAKSLLAQRLASRDWRSASLEEGKPSAASASPDIPLPRSRPVTANQDVRPQAAVAQVDSAPQADNRTLLQKLSDLVPSNIKLASLTPDGGLFKQGPDLAALGYDRSTAVYDISARAVYLPNGAMLEAHSGFGNLRDDPEHVRERMVGATPPATYDLKPRERLFHGVRALRMIPVDGSDTLGRSGLLTHSFMLGPNGDSNGCVSIRDYERFLKAFDNGEINRLVVVPSLNGAVSASQRTTSQS